MGDRIPFFLEDDCLITTIGQLNFFKWFISNNVFQYVESCISNIENEMNKNKKRTKRTKNTITTKKYKDSSSSSSPTTLTSAPWWLHSKQPTSQPHCLVLVLTASPSLPRQTRHSLSSRRRRSLTS